MRDWYARALDQTRQRERDRLQRTAARCLLVGIAGGILAGAGIASDDLATAVVLVACGIVVIGAWLAVEVGEA